MKTVLIVYYSRFGATKQMADSISLGVDMTPGVEAVRRCIPPVESVLASRSTAWCDEASPDLVADKDDLLGCSGLVLGSPTRFGNMAAPLKYFLDSTGDLWASRALANKPAGVFTSSNTVHGGQGTLLSMMIPILHHGMFLVGSNDVRGCPYGCIHVSGDGAVFSDVEKAMCVQYGKRIGHVVESLGGSL